MQHPGIVWRRILIAGAVLALCAPFVATAASTPDASALPSSIDFANINADNWRAIRIEMYRQHLKAERDLRLKQREEHKNRAAMTPEEKKAMRRRQIEERQALRELWLENRLRWRDAKEQVK